MLFALGQLSAGACSLALTLEGNQQLQIINKNSWMNKEKSEFNQIFLTAVKLEHYIRMREIRK